jgi:uncharacterized protein
VSAELESLLVVQERDLALDRLRHRRVTLPERSELEGHRRSLDTQQRDLVEWTRRRDEVQAEERRLDDEAQAFGVRAAEADQRLYSGTVTSPRELQALQADVELLRRHRNALEDRELEVMEERESLDEQIARADAEVRRLTAEIDRLEAVIGASEAEIDAELDAENQGRAAAAGAVSDSLLRSYEMRRSRNRGAGAARLVGVTCQACHLSIPSTEAERIRRAGGEIVAYCDNCGAILVP